ncbi:MAG: hypothetical protein JW779_01210 [Candidatus Thorarchaeota archaeon]|nr:hypothetical protein [Candidatus Thorarchaeota archaeon]
MTSESAEFEKVAPLILFGLNIGYGAFLTLFSLYGLMVIGALALIPVVVGLALMLVAWMYLKPIRKEGWLYAIILNIITIPLAILLLPDPVLMAFPITFAVLIVFIMILPPIRKPYS